ncbi:MAG TPA: OmpA family protein [Hanamia sp.]
MSFNLMETVKHYFTDEFTNQASSTLGESTSGITKALSAIIPTGLAGILIKATSGNDGANSILEMAKNAFSSNAGSPELASPENGSNMLSDLFGTKEAGINTAISQFSGVKGSSVGSLMSIGLPAIMGILGKHADENNLSASGLAGFLSSQKDHIVHAMPASLSSISGLLGLASLGTAASSMRDNLKQNAEAIMDKPAGNNWLLPLVIILAAVALLWYMSKSCNQTTPSTAAVTQDTSVASAAPDTTAAMPAASVHESIKVQLPNGKELDAYKGGIEDELVTFLKSNWKSLSADSLKNRWFNFDNLNFNTGAATLLPESEKQLDNIAEILKAFPDAKIKIGGYTDATGDAAANKKLSQQRAQTAKDGLDKRGVSSQIIGAEGYGSEYAKYPASASDADRAMDRHVSVSVRK